MTVSAAQLSDAVLGARRMKDALDAHLRVLEARCARLSEEGEQIPSDNQFFMYVAKHRPDARAPSGFNSEGLIRIQQDAAFIVEAFVVVTPWINPNGFGTPGSLFYEVALSDGNAERALSGGFHPDYTDGALAEEDSNFIPGLQLVPISGVFADIFVPNVDDWKNTRADYILPRGSVVRTNFRSTGAQAVGTVHVPWPDVILIGYKVF